MSEEQGAPAAAEEEASGYQPAAGHELVVRPGSSEAFPLGKTEVERFCRRLRSIVQPVLSHETWAATLLGVFIGLFVAYTSLPSTGSNENHLAYLHGVYQAGWIAAAAGAFIFGSLATRDRWKRSKSDAYLIADELEEICNERMPKPTATTTPPAPVP